MTVLALPTAARYCAEGFLIVLAAIIGVRLLTGGINTRGLLDGKSGAGRGSISPARVQLLISTLAAAGTYLGRAFAHRQTGRMPDVPDAMLVAVAGSHALYLASKALAFVRDAVVRRPLLRSDADDTAAPRESHL